MQFEKQYENYNVMGNLGIDRDTFIDLSKDAKEAILVAAAHVQRYIYESLLKVGIADGNYKTYMETIYKIYCVDEVSGMSTKSFVNIKAPLSALEDAFTNSLKFNGLA